MPSNKINPFFALEVTRDGLNEQFDNKRKMSKPVLSEEKIEDMEALIGESINFNTSLAIDIYKDGSIRTIEGIVVKVDNITREIILMDKIRVKFIDIVDIKVI